MTRLEDSINPDLDVLGFYGEKLCTGKKTMKTRHSMTVWSIPYPFREGPLEHEGITIARTEPEKEVT